MALVQGSWSVVVGFVDSGDNHTSRTYEVVAADAAAAATVAANIMARYNAIGDAVIDRYSVHQNFVEDALVLPATAEIENQAFFAGKILGDPTSSGTFSVPAPKATIFAGPSGKARNIVDMTDTDVIAYVNLFAGAGSVAMLSDGEHLTFSTVSGKRRHVKSNKG